jgi:hypothetical protein
MGGCVDCIDELVCILFERVDLLEQASRMPSVLTLSLLSEAFLQGEERWHPGECSLWQRSG